MRIVRRIYIQYRSLLGVKGLLIIVPPPPRHWFAHEAVSLFCPGTILLLRKVCMVMLHPEVYFKPKIKYPFHMVKSYEPSGPLLPDLILVYVV